MVVPRLSHGTAMGAWSIISLVSVTVASGARAGLCPSMLPIPWRCPRVTQVLKETLQVAGSCGTSSTTDDLPMQEVLAENGAGSRSPGMISMLELKHFRRLVPSDNKGVLACVVMAFSQMETCICSSNASLSSQYSPLAEPRFLQPCVFV